MTHRAAAAADDQRVLILAPAEPEAAAARDALDRHGFAPLVCAGVGALCAEWGSGAGVLLICADALFPHGFEKVSVQAADQPAWSDIPFLIVDRRTIGGAASERLKALPNVLLLARPVRVSPLVSAVRASLRARMRQYEVRNLMAQLREANHAKDDVIALVSHELRAPLGVIGGLSRSLVQRRDEPEGLAWAADTIRRNVDALARLAEDLVDLSRLERRQFRLHVEQVDLASTIAMAVDAIRPAADAKRLAVRIDVASPDALVFGDSVRLTQVLSNLLSNAVRSTPFDGAITVRLRRINSDAVITVRDTGEGIGAPMLPHVFEPFRQAEESSARHGGPGLGLAIVRQLVELHGGSVAAHSEGPGRGAEFTVRLPLHAGGVGRP